MKYNPARHLGSLTAVLALPTLLVTSLAADAKAVTIPTVPVGNAGNAAEVQSQGSFGAVGYQYRIGQYEVTNAQYIEFLNAKATSDPLELYDIGMRGDRGGITQNGSGTISDPYSYTLNPNMGDKPVNYVSWYDAIRFANWLHNGQGAGDTETGAYTLVGGTPTPSNGNLITRNPGATWFLPSQNEWYKAAYYDPTLGAGAGGYWDYATRSNSTPTIALANSVGDIRNPGANVANYNDGADWNFSNGNVTTVGSAGALSESFYGTSDQNGNVKEWNEALIGAGRGFRGGGLGDTAGNLLASSRGNSNPDWQNFDYGFRVAMVPEPSSAALAILGAVLMLLRKKNRKRLF